MMLTKTTLPRPKCSPLFKKLRVTHQWWEGDQVFRGLDEFRLQGERITGVWGGRQWARLVGPLDPGAHAHQSLRSLQVIVLWSGGARLLTVMSVSLHHHLTDVHKTGLWIRKKSTFVILMSQCASWWTAILNLNWWLGWFPFKYM